MINAHAYRLVLSKQEDHGSLLYFAEKYDLQKMKGDIELAMQGPLSCENAFRFLGLAYQFQLEKLEAMVTAVVAKNSRRKIYWPTWKWALMSLLLQTNSV